MKNSINGAMQILTICQGVWVLTLMGFLMWHYIMHSIKNRILEKNALSMGVSYSLLTIGTMISSLNGIYDWSSPWQVIVIIGYAFGDYAIVKMLFHTLNNYKTKKIIDDYIKKRKAEEDLERNQNK